MARGRTVTVYGTVMGTRPHGRHYMHHVEATAPGGEHMDLMVVGRKRHRGSVRVIWDTRGVLPPKFPFDQWGLLWTWVGIVTAIVVAGWFLFG